MKLQVKFNLILILTFSLGLIISGLYSYKLTEDNALNKPLLLEVRSQKLEVRSYSVKEVRPLTSASDATTFHPQTIPAYATTQVANIVREKRPNYTYKEAVFNSTNLRYKTSSQEEVIIKEFISKPT